MVWPHAEEFGPDQDRAVNSTTPMTGLVAGVWNTDLLRPIVLIQSRTNIGLNTDVAVTFSGMVDGNQERSASSGSDVNSPSNPRGELLQLSGVERTCPTLGS